MSVIAKLSVIDVKVFGDGQLVKLNCICENDLMAAYAKAHEDRLFTKYSPWGEAELHAPVGQVWNKDERHYLVALRGQDRPAFQGARIVVPSRVVSMTDFGGDTRRVEIASRWPTKEAPVPSFNWKMSIDNPPAAAFFAPGALDYWVGFYPESAFTIDEALADAHSPLVA